MEPLFGAPRNKTGEPPALLAAHLDLTVITEFWMAVLSGGDPWPCACPEFRPCACPCSYRCPYSGLCLYLSSCSQTEPDRHARRRWPQRPCWSARHLYPFAPPPEWPAGKSQAIVSRSASSSSWRPP